MKLAIAAVVVGGSTAFLLWRALGRSSSTKHGLLAGLASLCLGLALLMTQVVGPGSVRTLTVVVFALGALFCTWKEGSLWREEQRRSNEAALRTR